MATLYGFLKAWSKAMLYQVSGSNPLPNHILDNNGVGACGGGAMSYPPQDCSRVSNVHFSLRLSVRKNFYLKCFEIRFFQFRLKPRMTEIGSRPLSEIRKVHLKPETRDVDRPLTQRP